jgi:hypothetical protein
MKRKVFIRYPSGPNETKELTLKIANTTNGAVLRTYIGHHLRQSGDVFYLLVFHSTDDIACFVSEKDPLSALSSAKRIKLDLVVRYDSVSVTDYEGAGARHDIDLKLPAGANLAAMLSSPADDFALAFRSGRDLPVYRLVASSLPLLFQGWSHDPLIIVRRVAGGGDSREMFLQLRFSMSAGLCVFAPAQWGRLAVLQFAAEGGRLASLSAQQIAALLPASVRTDPAVTAAVADAMQQYRAIDAARTRAEFVDVASASGANCCFVDRVKFLSTSRKWRIPSNRYLYVAPDALIVTRDLCLPGVRAAFADVADVVVETDHVVVVLTGGDRWRIMSERHKVLVAAITQMRERATARADAVQEDAAPPEAANDSDTAQFDGAIQTDNLPMVLPDTREMRPGISAIACPAPEEGDQPFDLDVQLTREIKIITKLELPGGAGIVKMVHVDVPYLGWILDTDVFFSLAHRPARILVGLVVLLAFVVFLTMKVPMARK